MSPHRRARRPSRERQPHDANSAGAKVVDLESNAPIIVAEARACGRCGDGRTRALGRFICRGSRRVQERKRTWNGVVVNIDSRKEMFDGHAIEIA
jgi:hypothetical protein